MSDDILEYGDFGNGDGICEDDIGRGALKERALNVFLIIRQVGAYIKEMVLRYQNKYAG